MPPPIAAVASGLLKRCRYVSFFLAVAFAAEVQGPARAQLGVVTDLPGAEEKHGQAMAPITERREERLRQAKAAYAAALDQVQREATGRGDLDTALAAKDERARLAAAGPPEAAKALPKGILPHRQRFDQAVAQAQAVSNREEAAQTKAHLAVLDGLQTRITKKSDLEGAAEIKERRTKLAAHLAALESGKGTAILPPLPEARPAATPALASASPSTALGLAAIPVATMLKAKGAAADPAPDTVLFDGPAGNGRSGAKGILFKNESAAEAAGRAGSTWAFRYTRARSASEVQIIHPIGRGQAIAHIWADRVGLSAPDAWRDTGYGGGDPKRVRKTQDFDKIFPLQDGTEYTVVSRLSAGGAYELFMNGKLVATARASSGSPLDLTIPEGKSFPGSGRGKLEFKGTGDAVLPLKWSRGWSAILVGPMDAGENICRDVRFYPGVADVAMVKR